MTCIALRKRMVFIYLFLFTIIFKNSWAQPDLVCEITSLEKTILDPGEKFDAESITTNQGLSNAFNNVDGFFTNYYLSTNNTYEEEIDFFIGGENFGLTTILTPGESKVEEEELDLNKFGIEIPDGEYFLLLVTDPWRDDLPTGYINESNENNNVNVYPELLRVGNIGTPDLIGRILSVDKVEIILDNEGNPTESIAAVAEVENVGDGPTETGNPDGYFANYYLSTDNIYQPSDFFIGGENFGQMDIINAGAKVEESEELLEVRPNIQIPPAGCYNLIFEVDPSQDGAPNGYILEGNEFNNTFVYPEEICLVAPQADLTVENVSINPISGFAGANVDVSFTLRNDDLGNAGSSTICYYLSTNPILDGADTKLAEINVEAINGNDTRNIDQNVPIPNAVAAGNYFIIIEVDCSGSIVESNEGNNTASVAFQVEEIVVGTPDLVGSILSVDKLEIPLDGNGNPLETIAAASDIENIGDGPTETANPNGYFANYYLSEDTIFDSSDFFVGGENFGQEDVITAGESRIESEVLLEIKPFVSIPPPGCYHLLFVVDPFQDGAPNGFVVESNEFNNVFVFPEEICLIAPPADLQLSNLSVSSDTSFVGVDINVQFDVNNIGEGPSNAFKVCVYLSPDNAVDELEIPQVVLDGSSLLVGEVKSLSTNIGTPTTGNYFIIVVLDCENEVEESDEDNNEGSIPVVFIPEPAESIDLAISNGRIEPDTLEAGQEIEIDFELMNRGNAQADTSTICVYLSNNANLDESEDTFLESLSANALNANLSQPFNRAYPIPASTAPGSYFILLAVDCGENVVEINETNNVGRLRFEIIDEEVEPDLPDLSISVPNSSPIARKVGESFPVNFTILNNQASATADPSAYCIVLSDDPIYNPNVDIELFSSTFPALGPNESSSVSMESVVPVNTPVGSYYLLYIADCNNEITELDETNNLASLELVVVLEVDSASDLRVDIINLPNSVSGGEQVEAVILVENNGSLNTIPFNVCIYFSIDGNSQDDLLIKQEINSLSAQTDTTISLNFTIPNNADSGNFLLFIADCDGVTNDPNLFDNSVAEFLVIEEGVGCNSLAIPNIVTPNGDGENDLWEIGNLPADHSLRIVDRWGNEVFRIRGYQNNWPSQSIAASLQTPKGTYFYVLGLETVGAEETCTGTITLLK